MIPLTGQVTEAGGGRVTIVVDRDTPSYPAVGDVLDCTTRPDECHALLVSTWDGPPWRRTSLRCTRRGIHDWHGARLEAGPGGGVQTLEWQ